MATDSIIAEIRQARDALAKRFNYDLRAMIEDARQRQAASGRKTVSFPPKPVRRHNSRQPGDQQIERGNAVGRS